MSPRISSAELVSARRRQAQPTREPGEILVVWIPGKLESRVNGPQGITMKGRLWRTKKDVDRRDHACSRIFAALNERTTAALCGWTWKTPKVVRFIAYVGHEWDDDNLPPSCKQYRDALKKMLVIDDDAPSSGHIFQYEQVIDRKRDSQRGVLIRVRLRPMQGEEPC